MAKAAKPTKRKAAPSKKTAAKAAPGKQAKKPSSTKAKAPPSKPKRVETKAEGFDIAKLIDHPLVADLLAVGAMAAVAAIADHNVKTRTGEAQSGSSKAVKAAGKAAAAAVGKRLLCEVDAIRNTAKSAKPKKA